MRDDYLTILVKDKDIYLKIASNVDNGYYYYIRYVNNDFYYTDSEGSYTSIPVALSILYDNKINWNDVELCYVSKEAFDKYWNNYIYDRGKNKYPIYDLHFINQTHLIDFQKKLKFNYLQTFEKIKEEFGPIPAEQEGHLYIYFIE